MQADKYDLEAMKEAHRYHANILERIKSANLRGSRIADIGAGTGLYAKAWRDQTGKGPICIEVDPEFVQDLKGFGFEVISSVGDLQQKLDGAYSINVLEHIKDPTAFLCDVRRRMNLGGRLYIYVPAGPGLFSDWDRRVGHYRRFDLNGLKRCVAGSGYKVIDAGHADSLGYIATWLLKAVGRAGNAVSPSSVRFYDRAIFPVSQVLDHLVGGVFGKNCWVVAEAV